MVADFLSRPIALGDRYAVVGAARIIDGGKVVVVTGSGRGIHCDAADLIRVDELARLGGVQWEIGPGTGTTLSVWGLAATTQGTISHPAPTSGSMLQSQRMWQADTGASAGSSAGTRTSTRILWRGDAAGLGGFVFGARFGHATAVAQQRAFVGLHDSASNIGNVQPSSLIDMVGMAYDSAQTTWRIMHNDGSGTATAIDLGSDFPVNSTDVFDLVLKAEPNGSTIAYRVRNLVSGDVAEGSLSSNLPTAANFLAAHTWVNNGTTASAARLRCSRLFGHSEL